MPTPDDRHYHQPPDDPDVCENCEETEDLWYVSGLLICKDCREVESVCEMCGVTGDEGMARNGDVDYCTECHSVESFIYWDEKEKRFV